jgi:hypothetical protein
MRIYTRDTGVNGCGNLHCISRITAHNRKEMGFKQLQFEKVELYLLPHKTDTFSLHCIVSESEELNFEC